MIHLKYELICSNYCKIRERDFKHFDVLNGKSDSSNEMRKTYLKEINLVKNKWIWHFALEEV